jgi:hypothetical protein
MPRRNPDHPQAKGGHGRPLRHGRQGAVAQGHPDHEQADGVVGGVPEEIEGVSLERGRAGREARAEFDQEHGRVDREHGPQDAPVRPVAALRVRRLVVFMAAAVGAHGQYPFDGCRRVLSCTL